MRSLRAARARIGVRGALTAASVLALCLPLAACGAPSSSPTAGETPGPSPTVSADATVPVACSLLTPDLIEAATGVSGAKEKLDKDLSKPGTSVCEWKGSKADLPAIEVLITNLDTASTGGPGATPSPAAAPSPAPSASGGAIATQRAAIEASVGAATDAVVAGGTDAFVAGNGSVVGMFFQKVSAKKVTHSYYVQVTYTSGDSADSTIITKALAALVATAL
jgi:hypothetical protein